MAIINTPATGHGNKSEIYISGLTIHFNVFLNSTPKEAARLNKIKQAYAIVDRLDKKINLYGSCNKYFTTLPKGKNFSDFWRDKTIFIDYSPSTASDFFAAAHSNDKDVCITAWCLDTHNKWMIAATLVHEFAHIAGAPGGNSHAAEKAADKCGFKPQYNPLILGSIDALGKHLENLA